MWLGRFRLYLAGIQRQGQKLGSAKTGLTGILLGPKFVQNPLDVHSYFRPILLLCSLSATVQYIQFGANLSSAFGTYIQSLKSGDSLTLLEST